ncbi:hypothetical protein JCM9279_001007 [Rhodotorula babjevae]
MSDYGLGDPAGATAAAGATSSQRSRDDHGLVEVQWGREKIRVPLPPPSSPLSTLRASLYNITGVPPSHQKLIYSGAVLKDDLAPLSAYGLTDDEPASAADDADSTTKKSFWDSWSFAGRSSSSRSGRKLKKLVMLGSKDVSARVDDRLAQRKDLADLAAADAAAAGAAAGGGEGGAAAGKGGAGGKEPESEDALRARIRDVAGQKLDELEPQVRQVEEWLEQAQAQAASADESAEAPSAPSRTLIFLSEVLLQGLLKLDAFEIPSAYAEARKERKDAVRRVQDTLDRVDRAKEGWKQVAKP